jgi:molybdopterin molybdotransferase
MLTVSEALEAILREVDPLAPEARALGDSLGLTLAQQVLSDVDSPPFDKALMDGYAVRSEDISAGGTELTVVDEVTAGRIPSRAVESGQATRIMTGASIPDGVDAVVKVEDTEEAGENRVRILADSAQPEQNLIRRGTSMKSGEVVLDAGRPLRAQELAALAEMGCHQVSVRRRPTMAVLATGDELVPVSEKPGPGQIRNSNETMLAAQIDQAGGKSVPLGIARDERSHLREKIEAGLQHDVLLLSGGVSAGKLDLVPSELERAGVEQVFHKVRVKPGKPVWFGVLRGGNGPAPGASGRRNSCLVFGLPGNPVSSMVCFELFVRTAIRRLCGQQEAKPRSVSARLTHPHIHKDDRETYFPAAFEWSGEGPKVTLMKWHGSSDLQSTRNANAMAVFPAEPREHSAGDLIDVLLW